jgi:Spy/CpxP family protein refolding chaperone
MTATIRARVLGAALLIAMFAAGAVAGSAWTKNRVQGVNVNVQVTSALPLELKRLGLSAAQEDTLRRILQEGQRRTLQVLHDLEPRIRAVTDSVDIAIHSALTPAQRATLDASLTSRRRDVLERSLDTVKK